MSAWMPPTFREEGIDGENVPADDLLRPRALHVDDRRLAAHRNRFLDRADRQFGVHGRHEVPRQLDAFALDELKPGSETVTE